MYTMMRDERGQYSAVLILVVLIVAVVVALAACSARIVDQGEVNVVLRYGEATGKVLTPGFNWITPLVETAVEYPTRERSYEASEHPDESKANYTDFPVTTQTTDGQRVTITYTVLFSIPREGAVNIYSNIGDMNSVVENVVKANSRNLTRVIGREFEAEQLFSGDVRQYQEQVRVELAERFSDKGVRLNDFLVRDIDFDEDYVQAIENQQIAEEEIKTARFRAEAAEFEKQQTIRQAEAERERQILEAEAEAERIRLRADAEAYSITTRGEALRGNPELVQWEFIQQLATVDWMILPDSGVTPLLPIEAVGGGETVDGGE